MVQDDTAKRGAAELGEASFLARKERLLGQRSARAAAAAAVALDAAEQELERRVLRPAVAAAAIDPAKSFLDHKAAYDASDLLPLLRRMPKGAVLHTHSLSTGDFAKLVEAMQRDGHYYVWQGGGSEVEGALRAFPTVADAPEGWVPAKDCPKEELYRKVTLPLGLPTVEACWQEFGKLWERVVRVCGRAPFYFGRGGFLWSILQQQLDSNVMYLEIKELLQQNWHEHDGRLLTDGEWLERFRDTVQAWCAEHPGFAGARVVVTCLKNEGESAIRRGYQRAADLKASFPDYVAGFDLAGPEDLLAPIVDFAALLEEERAAGAARGVDLPLLLHAGETNVPEATQIVDAVALRCRRIGHGFALARHPVLLEQVLAEGVCLECCPISNQVLGYVPNLANHAALGLFRAGVPMTISSDDPGFWHYSDVSYDFAAATKAWNLELVELKALCRNSLAFSTLGGVEKEKALASWEERWQEWVKAELRRAGQKAD